MGAHDSGASQISITHSVVLEGDRVVKTFRSWERGEPRREWRGLNVLHRYAPGLGPEPISAELDAQPPWIVMSRVPGKPLGTHAVTRQQIDALVAALEALHRSVPAELLATADPQDDPTNLVTLLHRMLAGSTRPDGAASPVVREAFAAASEFVDSDWVARAEAIGRPSPAFGLCDGNLANYLWDGHVVRAVDFENAGGRDRAFDVADLVEHISLRRTSGITAHDLLERLDLRDDERERAYRPAFAVFWLLRLLPDAPSHRLNPPGSLQAQAEHLLAIL